MKKRDYFILSGIAIAAFLFLFFRKEKTPARISDKEAERILREGIDQRDPSGRVVHFGKRALDYIEKKADSKHRKSFLPWAIETVKTTLPDADDTDRLVYRKVFYSEKSPKGFVVLVDVRSSEVWDFLRKPAAKLGNPMKRSTKQGNQPQG